MEKEGKTPEGFKIDHSWNAMSKNDLGEAEIHLLHAFVPEQTPEDDDRFLSQASPTIINSAEIAPRRSKEIITIPINDIHFGYRNENGVLVPTHDPEAMDKILQLCKKTQPNEIIINGDAIDLPELGKYDLDSKSVVNMTQEALDGLHIYLSMLRAECPNSKIVYLEANHEIRSSKILIRNAMPMFGIRKANMPNDFAVTSIPNLLRLNELEIDYISGYPANSYNINDRLLDVHGEYANKPSSAAKYLGLYACSVYFGHTHRTEVMKKTTPDGKQLTAFNAGCACDTTGSIPSYHSGVDLMGNVTRRNEDWQKGVAVIETKKGDRPFTFNLIDLETEEMRYQGRVYKARADVVEALKNGEELKK